MDEKIIKHLIKLEKKMDREFKQVRSEATEFRNELLTQQDKAMVILQRLDQERIFTNEAIKRIQKQIDKQFKDIENHNKAISRIKKVLNIV